MAKILINNDFTVNGKVSISRTVNENKDGFIISGVFATHLYIEDIKSISTNRFELSGVEVYQESFGSDDYDILYNFTVKKFRLKDIIKDGVGYILYSEEMEQIEEEMYKHDHPILGGIGEQYKDMIAASEEDEENDDEQ